MARRKASSKACTPAANLPTVRPALPIHLPLRRPFKFSIIPDQFSDHGDFGAQFGRHRRQSRGRHRLEVRSIKTRFRQCWRAGQRHAHSAPVGCCEQRVALQVGRGPIRRDDIFLRALFHPDKGSDARTMGQPRLEAKRLEQVVDFPFLKVDGQIVGPIAGALLVAGWLTQQLVAIAKRPDEAFCVRFIRCQSTVAREFLCAGVPRPARPPGRRQSRPHGSPRPAP